MTMAKVGLWSAALCFAAGCGAAARDRRSTDHHPMATVRRLAREAPGVSAGQRELSRWNTSLPVAQQTIVRLAVARDLGLVAGAWRVRAMLAGARAEASLPPPEVQLAAWNVPMLRPYELGDAGMYMVELRQMIPAPGSLGARRRAMVEEARAMAVELIGREREIVRRASDAYADYARAWLEDRVRRAHVERVGEMLEALGARYPTGATMLSDVARLEVERAKERRHLARIRGALLAARATINGLLRRAPRAEIGPPRDVHATTIVDGLDALLRTARARRPAIGRARAQLRAADASSDVAEREATVPSFVVGGGYMQDPMERPGLSAMVSMTLPWLSGGGRARASASRARARAARAELLDAFAATRMEVAEAHAHARSIEEQLVLARDEVLPAAERSVEAMSAAYVGGQADLMSWIDAARGVLDAQIEIVELTGELARANARLELAVGAPLRRAPIRTERSAP